jgi:hypothetical protein
MYKQISSNLRINIANVASIRLVDDRVYVLMNNGSEYKLPERVDSLDAAEEWLKGDYQ